MILDVSHRTLYRYSAPVSQSHHLLHLTPRPHPRQTVLRHGILIEPAPASRTEFTDDFGNASSIITIEQDHTELVLHARSQVEVTARGAIDVAQSSSWEDVAAQLRSNRGAETFEAIQYTCPSRYIRPNREIYKFLKPSFQPGSSLLEAVLNLTTRIHRGFTYTPGVTDTATSVEEVLRLRRGVCQDFAHLEIACLRTLGLAARYVSGYLLTRPPEGQAKLVGADASHAWLSLWTPEHGWVDFDPTNNVIPGEDHVTLALGRDFQDVSPVSGVLLGGSSHEMEVGVDVNPAAASARPPV